MKCIRTSFLLLFCILLFGCAQNKFYAVRVFNNNSPQTENLITDNTESEISEFTVRSDIHENGMDDNIEEKVDSEGTQLVEFLEDDQDISEPAQLSTDAQDLTIGVPLNNVPTELSLFELENLAVNNHPEIQQSLADVSSMKGQRFQVTRKFNPVVGYQAQEVGNEGKAGQQGVYFNQTFITANKLGLNDQVAGHLVQQKSWDWQVKELDVRNNVQQNFYEYQGALLKLKLAQDLLKISEESSNTVGLLIEAGETKKSQLLQSDIQVDRSVISVNNQEENLKATLRKLIASVGAPELDNNSISGSLPDTFPVYNWDQLYENMLQSHPSIQAAYSQIQSASWAIKRAEVQKTPNIQTQLGVLYDTATLDTVVGLQIGGALPVHNKNRGNVRSRCADYMKAIQEVERIKLSLKSELAEAYQSYESTRVQSVKFRESILPKAKESMDLITQGFQQGQDPYIQLLIVQKTYFQSNQEYVDILVDVNQGLADLHKLKSID
jgi:outer membrane protein, heavy metal efflux system